MKVINHVTLGSGSPSTSQVSMTGFPWIKLYETCPGAITGALRTFSPRDTSMSPAIFDALQTYFPASSRLAE